ncbi:MAG: ATP-binding protein [Promethearchaeota archaeon]
MNLRQQHYLSFLNPKLSIKNFYDNFLNLTIEEQRKKFINLLLVILNIGVVCTLIFRFIIELTNPFSPIRFDLSTLSILIFLVFAVSVIILVINHYFQSWISGSLFLLLFISMFVFMYFLERFITIDLFALMILIILLSGVILPRKSILITAGFILGFIVILPLILGPPTVLILDSSYIAITISVAILVVGSITAIEWVKISLLQNLISTLRLKNTEIQSELFQRKKAQRQAEFFIDLVTHDLGNLNQGIISGLELLSYELETLEDSDDLQQTMDIVLNQLNSSISLVNNVRKFSQIDTELKEKDSLHRIELFSVLNRTIELVKTNFNKKIQFKTNIEKEKFWVLANEFLIDVFFNIIHNAVKYNTKEQVLVEVIASVKDNKFIEIQFRDNGPGIENKEIIFKRIEIGRISGSGMGLTLVKHIIESYGGQIWVTDNVPGEPSKGSNFIMLLPSPNFNQTDLGKS